MSFFTVSFPLQGNGDSDKSIKGWGAFIEDTKPNPNTLAGNGNRRL